MMDEQSFWNITGEAWIDTPTTIEVSVNPNPTPTPPPTPPPAPSGTVTQADVVEAFQFLADMVRQGRVTDNHMRMMGQFLVDLVNS